MTETKSRLLLPIAQFVTSPNFVLGIFVAVILFILVLLPVASAYSQEIIDRNGIKDIAVQELNQNIHIVTFDYCLNKYSQYSVGALVTSDLDAIPVPIDSSSVKYGYCAAYGTKILAKSDAVNLTLFQSEDISSLTSMFNAKIHDLKNNLADMQQKITEQKKLDSYSKIIDELVQKAELLEQQIKSAQSSLKTLITMNS